MAAAMPALSLSLFAAAAAAVAVAAAAAAVDAQCANTIIRALSAARANNSSSHTTQGSSEGSTSVEDDDAPSMLAGIGTRLAKQRCDEEEDQNERKG